ncbi:MAG: RsbRD N-terminal domain-containing protein [Polyangiaceae bacterium]|jgi:hypothetical protein|nr:RsbRD N-terminal domain-containing protein [Polyangiaceae bacterium]
MAESFLAHRRAALLQRWLDAVFDAYPANASRALRRVGDRFANPAGHLLTSNLPLLFDALDRGVVREQVEPPLEAILKLRALQDFTPSQAVDIVLAARRVLRAEFDPLRLPASDTAALAQVEERVDQMLLIAFDVYMRCREKVYEVRYEQLKKMNYTLLERANRLLDPTRPKRGAREENSANDEEGLEAPTDEGDEP